MSLTDRLNQSKARRVDPQFTPEQVERINAFIERREPRWVERMQDGKLPAKDTTGKAA